MREKSQKYRNIIYKWVYCQCVKIVGNLKITNTHNFNLEANLIPADVCRFCGKKPNQTKPTNQPNKMQSPNQNGFSVTNQMSLTAMEYPVFRGEGTLNIRVKRRQGNFPWQRMFLALSVWRITTFKNGEETSRNAMEKMYLHSWKFQFLLQIMSKWALVSSFFTPDYMDYTLKSPLVEGLLSKAQNSCPFIRNTMKHFFSVLDNSFLLKMINHFYI